MIHQRYKDHYYAIFSPIMALNYYKYKMFYKWFSGNPSLKLHLGCGEEYFEGFINIDGNILHKVDLWLDIRHGLPFCRGSVDCIYNSNFLEHFYIDECRHILKECLRVLKHGGGMRIIVPNLKNAIHAYVNNLSNWFEDWPSKHTSLGGRFSNLVFCHGQHRNAFDFSYLEELLREIGFSSVVEQHNGGSSLFNRQFLSTYEIEKHPYLSTYLYVETFK